MHVETLSATSRKRLVYERVKGRLEAGDELVIWDLDRAYRSARDALNKLDALQRRGVNFVIANFKLDTTTPEGYHVYTIMSANGELERRMLSRRTKEGLAAARLRGQTLGRPRKLTQGQIDSAWRRLQTRESTVTAMAHEYHVARSTLSRALNQGASHA